MADRKQALIDALYALGDDYGDTSILAAAMRGLLEELPVKWVERAYQIAKEETNKW